MIAIAGTDDLTVTSREKSRAELEIKLMRKSLAGWLSARRKLAAAPTILPLTELSPVERRLGKRLYVLLAEMFDAQALPPPTNPMALAEIAVSGRLSSEAAAPAAQGMTWLWPAVAVVGLVLFTVVVKVRTDADQAKHEADVKCIESGRCTDTGFWLKLGGIMLVAWLAWDKFGLREAVEKRKTAL